MRQRLVGTGMIAAAVVALSLSGLAQAGRPFTTAFPKEEFAARRLKIAEAIGREAVALVQAAATVHSSAMFRQSNEFFYVTGVGIPQAMLLIDGATKKSTLYLPKQDASRAAVEGALLSSDDPASVVVTTGIDEVKPADALQADLAARNKDGRLDLFVPFQPAEGSAESRDGATRRSRGRSRGSLGRPDLARGAAARAVDDAGRRLCDTEPVADPGRDACDQEPDGDRGHRQGHTNRRRSHHGGNAQHRA